MSKLEFLKFYLLMYYFFTQDSYSCEYRTAGILDSCVFGFRKKSCGYITDLTAFFFFFYFSRWLFSWNYASNIRHWFSPLLYWVGRSLNAWFYCQYFICVLFFFFFLFTFSILCIHSAKLSSLYFFAPGGRMIMIYFVPVCPLLPFSADTTAVLHMRPSVHQFIN